LSLTGTNYELVLASIHWVQFNSLASTRIQRFSKKTPKRTWLCARISPVWYALQTR